MSEKWGKLLQSLLELTKEEQLDWEITSTFESDDVIQTTLGDYTIEISETVQPEGFVLKLSNDFGKVMDVFDDDDLTAQGYPMAFSDFSKLFKLVKREASGAEAALNKVLDELQKKVRPF